jgi:hypothetical protein
MIAIPKFILDKFYVKGSLKPHLEGGVFQMKNALMPGHLTQIHEVAINGNTVPLESIWLQGKDRLVNALSVAGESPFSLKVAEVVDIVLKNLSLESGQSYQIKLDISSLEVGRMTVNYQDQVA